MPQPLSFPLLQETIDVLGERCPEGSVVLSWNDTVVAQVHGEPLRTDPSDWTEVGATPETLAAGLMGRALVCGDVAFNLFPALVEHAEVDPAPGDDWDLASEITVSAWLRGGWRLTVVYAQ